MSPAPGACRGLHRPEHSRAADHAPCGRCGPPPGGSRAALPAIGQACDLA